MEQDHDLLITVATDVRNIVKTLDKLEARVGSLATRELPCAANFKACSKLIDQKVSWRIFVLFLALVTSLISYNYVADSSAHSQVIDNAARIELNSKGFNPHVDNDN